MYGSELKPIKTVLQILLLFVSFYNKVHSQTSDFTIVKNGPNIDRTCKVIDYTSLAPEIPASFPGGDEALNDFIQTNQIYPVEAISLFIQGTVECSFIIEADGTLSNVGINEHLIESLDREALRLISLMPRWNPAKCDGIIVRAWHTLPIKFILPKDLITKNQGAFSDSIQFFQVFLDSAFEITEQKKAVYIRNAIQKNTRYYITDNTLDAKTYNYCEYSSITPWIEDGKALHFRNDGSLYSSGSYKNGEIYGEWIYYKIDGTTDTVFYSSDFFTRCPGKINQIQISKTQLVLDISDSLQTYFSDNFHLPARARDFPNYFNLYLNTIFGEDGKIICRNGDPLIIHTDILKEIDRILESFNYPVTLRKPLSVNINLKYENQNEHYTKVNRPPIFYYKGKTDGFNEYLEESLDFLPRCGGTTIPFSFIVEVDGKISSVNLGIFKKMKIENGNLIPIKDLCDEFYKEELQRVLISLPLWEPAIYKGKPVRVRVNANAKFKVY